MAIRLGIQLWSVTIFSALVVSTPARAGVVANFTGDTPQDQYPGIAGLGWTDAWGTSTGNGSFTSATVTNASPLAGGGNYLAATFTATTSTAEKRGFIRRNFEAFEEVDPTQPHRVVIDFRLDSSLTTFSNTNDYIVIYDHIQNNVDTSADATWFLRAHGATTGSANAQEWVFYNGNPSSTGFDTSRFVNSGIDLVSGNVYRFTIDTDPTTETYQGTVEDLTAGGQFTTNVLNWRSQANNTTGAGTVLHVGARVDSQSEVISYSFDSLQIVPEPATAGLVGISAIAFLARRRSRQG